MKRVCYLGLQKSKKLKMAGSSHDENEDLEVSLVQLEQSIDTLTMLVMQLVEKDREATLADIGNEEYNLDRERDEGKQP